MNERLPRFGSLGRGWMILLVASLAANLVIAGIVIGAALSGPSGAARPGGPRDVAFGSYTHALSRDDREALRLAMRARRPASPPSRETERADRRDMAALLRADSFDPDRVAALLEAQRSRLDDRFRLGQTLLLERLGTMTIKARHALADRLEAMTRRR